MLNSRVVFPQHVTIKVKFSNERQDTYLVFSNYLVASIFGAAFLDIIFCVHFLNVKRAVIGSKGGWKPRAIFKSKGFRD